MTDLLQSMKERRGTDRALVVAAGITMTDTVAAVLGAVLVFMRAWDYHTPIG